ncbi:MAG TPA: DUF167 domain-containing protein [Thermoleophilia bacterium]|nr:DUF167 domain-containing protein [Thermoleophilia bacterium]
MRPLGRRGARRRRRLRVSATTCWPTSRPRCATTSSSGEPSAARAAAGGVLLNVWVVPGAQRSTCEGERDGCLRVHVRAPARQGRANEELERLLAGWLDVPRADVTIVSGARARRKVARVAHLSVGDARLESLLSGR